MAKGVFLRCGRKFSKSEVAIVFGHLICMIFPGSHGYYIADTMKHAGELVWHNRRLPDFYTKLMRYPWESKEEYAKKLARGQQLEKKWVLKKNNSDMRKYFTNGSWFKVDGADNYSNADGMNPHFIIYDEFKHHDPKFHEAMEPNLTTNKAPILIVGTPPEGTKSYYTKIERDFQMSKGFRTFCMPSYYNTYIYPEGKEDPDFLALKKRYEDRGDGDVFEREYLAKYVKGGSKAIFPVFDSPQYDETGDKIIEYSRHVRPHNEILAKLEFGPKDWDYYVAYDAGTVTCFAACFAAVNSVTKECLILDEIYETTQSETTSRKIYNRANAIKAQYSHADDWYEVYDNAAAWFANDVHSEFEDASLIPCTKDYNKKEDRLSMIKDMMIFDYFKMSERAVKGRWEIENYYVDDKGRIPKEDDHFIDTCFRGDTEVTTLTGPKRIDQIKKGDMVLTGDGRYNTVNHCWDNGKKEIYKLNNSLHLTLGHRIYTLNRGFVKAEELTKGDVLCSQKMALWKKNFKGRFIRFGLIQVIKVCVVILDALRGRKESIICIGKSGKV